MTTDDRAAQNAALKSTLDRADLTGLCGACQRDASACQHTGGGRDGTVCAGFVADERKVAGILALDDAALHREGRVA